MRIKRLVIIAIISLVLFSACSASDSGISFDNNDYQTFHYKGQDYAICQEEVTEESIYVVEARFMEWPVVREVMLENEKITETVSLNNLYQTKQGGFAMGIQDKYYKVVLEENVAETNRIDYQKVLDKTDSEIYLEE